MPSNETSRHVLVAVMLAAVLGVGCVQEDGTHTSFSCEELEREENIEFVLCDDGETRIDRRDEFVPASPQAEQ
jgi:hypothetical protein